MRAEPPQEPVGEPAEVDASDGVEHLNHGALNDRVLQPGTRAAGAAPLTSYAFTPATPTAPAPTTQLLPCRC